MSQAKRSKRELELEALPKPIIRFGDMDSRLTESVLNAAKSAYLAKNKGEVESWKGESPYSSYCSYDDDDD